MLTEKELQVVQRRSRGESQRQIAKALQISQAAVSKFETNAHQKILDARRLLDIAGQWTITEQGLAGEKVVYRQTVSAKGAKRAALRGEGQ